MTEPPDEPQSPWERDDWMPEHQGPIEISGRHRSDSGEPPAAGGPPPPSSFEHATHADASNSASTGRTPRAVVGIVAALALTAAGVMVLARPGNDSQTADRSVSATVPASTPTPTPTITPTTTPTPTPTTPLQPRTTAVPTPRDGSIATPDLSVIAVGQPIAEVNTVVDLEVPIWTEWTIPVPDVLARLAAPTEVVVLTQDGSVHRIEFPSGRVRSVAIDGPDSQPGLAVNADSIAVSTFGSVLLLTEGLPARDVDISNRGVGGITARANDFVVAGRQLDIDEAEPLWLLAADGGLVDVTGGPLSDAPTWERSFLQTGELLLPRPGGVYAVGDDGAARRISDGALVASGRSHIAVERCDESLDCGYFVMDVGTGAETAAALAPLDRYRYWETSTRIAPDGRSIQFADWQRAQAVWRLLDVETGDATDLGPIDGEIRSADTWAADGSGVFADDDELLTFHAVDGTEASISGLGRIRAVATRPSVPDP